MTNILKADRPKTESVRICFWDPKFRYPIDTTNRFGGRYNALDGDIASEGGIFASEDGIVVSEGVFNRFRERHHCSEGGIIPSEGGIIVAEGVLIAS